MFSAYTPIDKCIGRGVQVKVGKSEYSGMLAGVYHLGSMPVLVITPMNSGGLEQHIPLQGAVVTIRNDS